MLKVIHFNPLGASLFALFLLILAVNMAALDRFMPRFLNNSPIGGEVVEVISADSEANESSGSVLGFSSALSALAAVNGAPEADVDMEYGAFDESGSLMTGDNSILQNQSPVTVPTPEPKPAPRPAPYYGPSLPPGYLIFPTTGYNRGILHSKAVDISRGDDCLYEDITVFAAAAGVVTKASWANGLGRYDNGGAGNNISILHSNGVTTRYYHLKKILVETGAFVNQGAPIAYMGGYPGVYGSGNSTGCHLHFVVDGAAHPFVRF